MSTSPTQKLMVGLTGGIGSGKSTVAQLFAELGIAVIDADRIAREVVQPGSAALQAIVDRFGNTLLQTDGTLDRQQLKTLIFNDAKQRQWLEQLLHPLIRQQMQTAVEQRTSPYYILVIPLLVEAADPHPLVNRVLVVDAPQALQIERIQQRDQLTPQQINSILQSQVSREARLAAADDVIVNDQGLDELKQHVQHLHNIYLAATPGSRIMC